MGDLCTLFPTTFTFWVSLTPAPEWQSCNAGTPLFQPPLSTGPLVVIIIIIIVIPSPWPQNEEKVPMVNKKHKNTDCHNWQHLRWNGPGMDLSIPGGRFPGVELRPESIGDSHLAWGCYIWKVFRWDVQKSTIWSSCLTHIQVFEKVPPANWRYFGLVSTDATTLPIYPI